MFKITVGILGMECPMCETHANEAIKRAIDPKRVSSSHKTNRTIIIAKEVDEEKIKAAIEGAGYQVTDITAVPYEKEGFIKKFFLK